MSYHEYKMSQQIAMQDYPFYGLIMAAMRKADTVNQAKFKAMWPEVWNELQDRYNAPGGLLGDEVLAPVEDISATITMGEQ